MSKTESLFDGREPVIGPRLMTLSRQRLCIGFVESVVEAITQNKLDAGTIEALRSSGTYILTHPEHGDYDEGSTG